MPAKKPPKTLGRTGRVDQAHDLTCPSGATCSVRRPGVSGLIKLGLLDSLDSLTGLVQVSHFDRVDGKAAQEAVKAFAADAESVKAGLALMDKIVVGCVVDPTIHSIVDGEGQEIPEADRDPESIYVDSIDTDDKSFILQFAVGGSGDLEEFRRERDRLMGNVPAMQDVPLPAKRAAGGR